VETVCRELGRFWVGLEQTQGNKAMAERKACELLPNLVVAISAARVRRGGRKVTAYLLVRPFNRVEASHLCAHKKGVRMGHGVSVLMGRIHRGHRQQF